MRYGVALLTLVALFGCSNLAEVEAGIVGIEVTVPSPPTVQVGTTIQLSARALNRQGNTVTAPIVWRTPDTTVSVDSATGIVTGVAAGTGRVQAASGSLSSGLVTLTVVDTLATP